MLGRREKNREKKMRRKKMRGKKIIFSYIAWLSKKERKEKERI